MGEKDIINSLNELKIAREDYVYFCELDIDSAIEASYSDLREQKRKCEGLILEWENNGGIKGKYSVNNFKHKPIFNFGERKPMSTVASRGEVPGRKY